MSVGHQRDDFQPIVDLVGDGELLGDEAVEDQPIEPEVVAEEDDEPWDGAPLVLYEVGDPGRAAREVVPVLGGDPSDPADTQVDDVTSGSLVVRAASARGPSHRHGGTPRQDDYALCAAGDRWVVAAVADGVSAGPLSHHAAAIACRNGASLVRDALVADVAPGDLPWDDIVAAVAKRIVTHGQRVLADAGGEDDEPVAAADVARAMATTLAIVAVEAEPGEDGVHTGRLIAVGDTSAFLLDAGGDWRALTGIKNDGAEVASSATAALPYLPATGVVATDLEIPRGEALFVMTDGVGDPLGHGEGAVGRFLATVWSEPPDPLSFGAQMMFARRSFDDDRTAVGIWAAP